MEEGLVSIRRKSQTVPECDVDIDRRRALSEEEYHDDNQNTTALVRNNVTR